MNFLDGLARCGCAFRGQLLVYGSELDRASLAVGIGVGDLRVLLQEMR